MRGRAAVWQSWHFAECPETGVKKRPDGGLIKQKTRSRRVICSVACDASRASGVQRGEILFWQANYTSNEPYDQTCIQSAAARFIMLTDQRSKARLAACVMSQIRLFKIDFGTNSIITVGKHTVMV